jgi:hypothetical protein
MTPKQLRLLYGESFRQEARDRLRLLSTLVTARGTEKGLREAINSLKIQAFPPEEGVKTPSQDEIREQLEKALGADRIK